MKGSHAPSRRLARVALAALTAAVAAPCAGCPLPVPPRPPPAVRMVVTERWAGGGRLVVVDDAGDRQAVLVDHDPDQAGPVRDEQAAFSPDGRWIAFVSTRGQDLDHTRLLVVAARPGAMPLVLTGPGFSVQSPTWAPDGGLVFASDRAGSYDLYRLELDARGRPRQAPVRLTAARSHELAPTIAADGRIAAQVIEPGLAPRSYLALVEPGGALTPLTDGPLDATPSWAPDGRRLAYATVRLGDDGREDEELMILDTGRDRRPAAVTDLPTTDESGPVWSRDGRWLFATSVVLADDRSPRWSSVIVVDVREPRFTPRMLRDRVGAIIRAGPALAPVHLDGLALGRAPPYLPALAQALRELDEEPSARDHSDPPPPK